MQQLKPFKNLLFALSFFKEFAILTNFIFQMLNAGYWMDEQTLRYNLLSRIKHFIQHLTFE